MAGQRVVLRENACSSLDYARYCAPHFHAEVVVLRSEYYAFGRSAVGGNPTLGPDLTRVFPPQREFGIVRAG